MPAYPQDISPDVELIRDVEFGSVAVRPLLLDLARPKKRLDSALPAFVYMHGGAWESGSKEDGIPAICYYAQHGFIAASIGYRLSGEAQYPAQIEDCKCAVRFLRAKAAEYGIDPARIGAMGASSGGHLAVLLGLTGGVEKFEGTGGWGEYSSKVSAVCDLFGVTDFLQMPKRHFPDALSATARFLGGTIDQVPERYVEASPVNYVHPGAPPFLIIHGDADALVPLHQSELLHAALRKAAVHSTFHIAKGTAHGSRNVITPEVRAMILAFLTEKLRSA
jgi:acetyl esterase/lipase